MHTQKARSAVHPHAAGAYPPWKIESTTIVALTEAPRPNRAARDAGPAIEATLLAQPALTIVSTVQSSDVMGETCSRRLALSAHKLLTATPPAVRAPAKRQSRHVRARALNPHG